MALLTSYWGLDGIILLLSAIAMAYFYMTRKFKYWKKKGVIELPPSPFIGNFADCILFKRSAGHFLRNLYENSKGLKCLGFYVFDKPSLLIRDPEIIKLLLIKDFQYFIDRLEKVPEEDGLGHGNLFMIDSSHWKFLRSKLSPIFTSGRIKKMFTMIETVSKDLETHLESLGLEGEGRVIELKETCAKFTTDNIATIAYGLQVNSLNNPDAEFRKCGREIFNFTYRRAVELSSFFFAPGLIALLGFKAFSEDSSKFLRNVFWETINNRIKSGIKRNDLIDTLVELKQSQANDEDSNGFKLDGDNLVAQAAVFFTAGYETTSTTISFALYELSLHLHIQNRLRSEINAALEQNSGKLTYEMVMTLPYLHMVVSETLRKYPPLPFLNRIVTADYNIPGTEIVLEKGTPVYIPMFGLHYDDEYFPDPENFVPERFSEDNKHKIPPFTYMPFGEGPRNCIGLRLGLLQAKFGLINIISKYEVTTCDQTQIPLRYDHKALLLASEGGLYLNVRKI